MSLPECDNVPFISIGGGGAGFKMAPLSQPRKKDPNAVGSLS